MSQAKEQSIKERVKTIAQSKAAPSMMFGKKFANQKDERMIPLLPEALKIQFFL